MKVIVGLGNPGPKYEQTRHNVGFWVVDKLAVKLGVSVTKAKFQSLVGESRVGHETVLLVKPQTFMNLSGMAVQEVVNYYRLQAEEDVIIVYDDMDFAPGQLKLRARGSAGGHNGIKSIVAQLGTESFCRMRLGIGRPAPGMDVIGHVLGTFSKDDRVHVDKAAEAAAEAALYIVEHGFERAMNEFNQVSF
ncbi:aminoacyl-tRNA hydrolase [Alicyclobacillus fastidiosus]|uniref:Peptidyl-tRNA hydrolase n=1 Tax=Alicyclobacillus fastidiosus TaxID=392011 RepID=A0ABV5AEJ6_9BACL|nr:aminoacyl-tRNA hydrolase [Alicyclobacillus fastidiosus]WEH09932.1 aminoacyl-tRNA hydrolase [Alicyclobacillus fastidiosus]